MLPNLEILARLLLAALLGSAIGFERERLLWAAGIRTHMLVCVGACLIMIVSSFGFADIMGTSNVVLDPSRVAAQVVSGIGLAIGGGLYFAGIASTLVILVILAGVKPLEDIYRARNQSCNLEIKAEHGILTPELLKKTLHIRNGQLKRFMVQPSSKRGIDDLHVALTRVSPKDVHNFMEKLEGLQAVRGVKRQK